MPKRAQNKAPPIQRPLRDPDHLSKRNVPYWWAPEWIRGTSAQQKDSNGQYTCNSYGKIKALKDDRGVNLHMLSSKGTYNYIEGSIQQEFKSWHEDRKIDYILLGEDPEKIDELIINDTE